MGTVQSIHLQNKMDKLRVFGKEVGLTVERRKEFEKLLLEVEEAYSSLFENYVLSQELIDSLATKIQRKE